MAAGITYQQRRMLTTAQRRSMVIQPCGMLLIPKGFFAGWITINPKNLRYDTREYLILNREQCEIYQALF